MRLPFALVLSLCAGTLLAQQPSAPARIDLKGMAYDAPFFPGTGYDASVPSPDSILGYRLGDKAASPAEIEAVVKAIAAASPRVKLFQYATTHEGRPLYYLAVTKPDRIARLDDVRTQNNRLSDPRLAPAAEIDGQVEKAPLVAWMAYCIHGDEMSGSDAALAVLYRLAAGTDEATLKMLDDLV
ncbi:MAG: M14 family zinc carboxypeptidase, partial [Phycisphaerales bacterium]